MEKGKEVAKYKTAKEDLQEFFGLLFGKEEELSIKAEQMRSGIYKIGGGVGVGVVVLALLLLKFTG